MTTITFNRADGKFYGPDGKVVDGSEDAGSETSGRWGEHSTALVDVVIHETVKFLTDADFGHLPTTRAVGDVLRLAADRIATLSFGFMEPSEEMDKVRERFTTFDDGRLPITPAELECLDAIDAASRRHFNGDEEMSRVARWAREQEEAEAVKEERYRRWYLAQIAGQQPPPPPWLTQPTPTTPDDC